VRDRDVPKPVLNRPSVYPIIGELVAAGMPKHVEMHRKRNARTLTDDLHQPIDGIRRKRRADQFAAIAWRACKHPQTTSYPAYLLADASRCRSAAAPSLGPAYHGRYRRAAHSDYFLCAGKMAR